MTVRHAGQCVQVQPDVLSDSMARRNTPTAPHRHSPATVGARVASSKL